MSQLKLGQEKLDKSDDVSTTRPRGVWSCTSSMIILKGKDDPQAVPSPRDDPRGVFIVHTINDKLRCSSRDGVHSF
jgi:hypothetical protein